VQTSGQLTLGGTTAAGLIYIVAETAGGICPSADLNSSSFLTILGYGLSATVIQVLTVPGGVEKA
jgi:hypothetical protein